MKRQSGIDFSMNKLKSLQNQARFNPAFSTPLSAVNADISPVKGRYKAVRMETSLVIMGLRSQTFLVLVASFSQNLR